MIAVALLPPEVAVMVTCVGVETGIVVIVKLAVKVLPPTTTKPGTMTAGLSL